MLPGPFVGPTRGDRCTCSSKAVDMAGATDHCKGDVRRALISKCFLYDQHPFLVVS